MSYFKLLLFSIFFIANIICDIEYYDYDNNYLKDDYYQVYSGYEYYSNYNVKEDYDVNYGYDYYTNNYVQKKDDFYCDQKVGRNNITFKKYKTKICPSRKCMVFYDFCDNFWATSCFDPKSPMHLAKKYKGVQNRHRKNNSSTSKFYLCEFENCTANIFKELNSDYRFLQASFINPEPISFDFKLWPKLGKEQRYKKGKMKNGIAADREIVKNALAKFNGYALRGAKKLWIEFQFLNQSGNFNYVKFHFNISDSTMTYKVNGRMAKTVPWIGLNPISDDLEINFKNSDLYQFVVNKVSINFTLSKNATGNLHTVYFGGHWDYVHGIFGSGTLLYPSIPIKTISCPEDIKLANPEMNITNVQQYFNSSSAITFSHLNPNPNSTFYISMLENYETKSYELRSSLCPGADIIRFDISIVKHAKEFYVHPNIWFRRNLRWTKFSNWPLQKPNCTEIKAVASSSFIWFICGSGEALVDNILGKNVKYLIEEKKKKYVCGK